MDCPDLGSLDVVPWVLRSAGILLITGIMASGKSTIAQMIAEGLPRSVHVRGHTFRRMIVSGQAKLQPDLAAEAVEQLRLRYRAAATVAGIYCDAGFVVVYQDVILGSFLTEVVGVLRRRPLHVVVLCPTADVAARRDATRGKTAYNKWSPHELDRELRLNTPRLGLWLDTSTLSPRETVKAIFDQFEGTRAGLQ